jgi:site-specific DNA recombinase
MHPSRKPLRLVGYVRVSDVGGRGGATFISPSVQRERMEAWCSPYGAHLHHVLEELDESGGRPDRPLLLNAIERVERGLSDGVIVAKLDRFGRSFEDALEQIERIDRAGGRLISVQDQFDLGTDHGRLVLRLMLSFAEFERDRIRTSWDDAQRKAVERGIHTATQAPTGYRKGRDRRLRVDPRTARAIREAFAKRARGATLPEVGRYCATTRSVRRRARPCGPTARSDTSSRTARTWARRATTPTSARAPIRR